MTETRAGDMAGYGQAGQIGASQKFAADCQKPTLHCGFRQRLKPDVLLYDHAPAKSDNRPLAR